jgi:hypothetical protein
MQASSSELFAQLVVAGQTISNSWRIKQNDQNDRLTSFIYSCPTFDDFHLELKNQKLSLELESYATHRWRNFKRHEAWLQLLFEQIPSIKRPSNTRDKEVDFFLKLDGEVKAFDLKVTRLPHSLRHESKISNESLVKWFYQNQSKQGRWHLAGRFFIVGHPENQLYDYSIALSAVQNFVEDHASKIVDLKFNDQNLTSAVIIRLDTT